MDLLSLTGDYLDAVPKAVRMASDMYFMKMKGFRLAKKKQKRGRTTRKWRVKPIYTVEKYRPSCLAALSISSISTICLARIDATPRGDNLKTTATKYLEKIHCTWLFNVTLRVLTR